MSDEQLSQSPEHTTHFGYQNVKAEEKAGKVARCFPILLPVSTTS